MTPDDVIHFWVDEVGEKRWFDSDPALDADIRNRFAHAYGMARDDKLSDWQDSAEGTLAVLILLDQFPRNMFRGRAEAFATDAQAREIAKRAIARGFDLASPVSLRSFFYLPLMHSENAADQDRCVSLIAERIGEDSRNYPFALGHRETIRRFGRFPARNAALGRQSTPEEAQFLAQQPHA